MSVESHTRLHTQTMITTHIPIPTKWEQNQIRISDYTLEKAIQDTAATHMHKHKHTHTLSTSISQYPHQHRCIFFSSLLYTLHSFVGIPHTFSTFFLQERAKNHVIPVVCAYATKVVILKTALRNTRIYTYTCMFWKANRFNSNNNNNKRNSAYFILEILKNLQILDFFENFLKFIELECEIHPLKFHVWCEKIWSKINVQPVMEPIPNIK